VSLLSDAVAGAFTVLQGIGGECVIYCIFSAGTRESEISLTAVPGVSTYEQDSEMGLERWEARDFLIRSCDLVTGNPKSPYQPRNNDEIRWNGRRYRVTTDGGAPAFDYMDTTNQLMRVHTKHIADC
jgi:hypothetical protein